MNKTLKKTKKEKSSNKNFTKKKDEDKERIM